MRTLVLIITATLVCISLRGADAGPNFLDGVMPAPLQLALLQDPATETPAQIYREANNIPIFVYLTVADSVTQNFAFNNFRAFNSQNDEFRFYATITFMIFVPLMITAFFQMIFWLATCTSPERNAAGDGIAGIYALWVWFRVALFMAFGVIIVVVVPAWSISLRTFMFDSMNIGLQLFWWIGWMYITLAMSELALGLVVINKDMPQANIKGFTMQEKIDNANGSASKSTLPPPEGKRQGDLDWQLFARMDRRNSALRMSVYLLISVTYWVFAFTCTNQTYAVYMGVIGTMLSLTAAHNILTNGEVFMFDAWTPKNVTRQTLLSFSFFSDLNVLVLIASVFACLIPQQPILIFFVDSNEQWYEGFVVFGLVVVLLFFLLVSVLSIWTACSIRVPEEREKVTDSYRHEKMALNMTDV